MSWGKDKNGKQIFIDDEQKPEVKVSEPESSQPMVIKTEVDAYINEMIKSQPQTVEEVEVRDFNYDRPASMVAVAPEIKEIFERRNLAYRWIYKKKQAIDHAIYRRGWIIVNRTMFPELKRHHFTANGTIETGDLMLAFMPEAQAFKLRNKPREESADKVRSLPMESAYKASTGGEKIGYYKPAYQAEPDGVVERKGRGLYAQPDLPTQDET
jgi:hypothetical protein